MPDNNDRIGKTAKNFSEKVEDNIKLAEEALYNSSPLNCADPMIAANHSHQLLKEAREALKHNDKEEAAHQLRREVDFCNQAPELAEGVYKKTGKAGLKALAQQKSSLKIIRAMESTWKKNWALDTTAFRDRF